METDLSHKHLLLKTLNSKLDLRVISQFRYTRAKRNLKRSYQLSLPRILQETQPPVYQVQHKRTPSELLSKTMETGARQLSRVSRSYLRISGSLPGSPKMSFTNVSSLSLMRPKTLMAAYLHRAQRHDRMYVSQGLIIQSKTQPGLSESQKTFDHSLFLEESPTYSREGLVIRLRSKRQKPNRRSHSDLRRSALPELGSYEKEMFHTPILKPKKAKSPYKVRSASAIKAPGVHLETSLPRDYGRKVPRKGFQFLKFPTMLMLRLIKSKEKRPIKKQETKASPCLKYVTLECPAQLAAAPVRSSLVLRRNRHRSNLSAHTEERMRGALSVRHLTVLSLEERARVESPIQENSIAEATPVLPSPEVKRKIVFMRRDGAVDDLTDPDYDLSVGSYYV